MEQLQGINYEQETLAASIKARKAWESIYPYAESEDFTERGKVIWEAIADFYQRDEEASHAQPSAIKAQISLKIRRPSHRELFNNILDALDSVDVSPSNAAAYFLGLKRENTGIALASAIAAGGSEATIRPLLDKYNELAGQESIEGETEEEAQGLSVREVFESSYGDGQRIEVWPDALNLRLGGGCIRGHHIVLFARPECGKTMMMINMTAGFLSQGLKVLYVSNEDPLPDLVLRTVARLTGRSINEVKADLDGSDRLARENNYENVVFKVLEGGSVGQISSLAAKHKPDVLVLDQLRNLGTRKDDSRVEQLEVAARGIRNLGKQHSMLVVSVTQAGNSAEGKAVLDMGDVDSSKTGIAGACDVMIGMGATMEDEQFGRRVLSLPKNKVGGGDHSHFPVMVNTQTGTVRSSI
jgi:archaellum biogenesis ATPase FlaH